MTATPGSRFGRLVVLSRHRTRGGVAGWLCLCDCGNRSVVPTNKLHTGHTRSCGCQQRKVDGRGARFKHGMAGTPEHRAWKGMRGRCQNETGQDYPNYGGRGIRVCERWQTFENFYVDMGPRPSPRHSVERDDVNGNYEPGNCRWAIPKEQARNRRTTLRLSYGGETLPLVAWAERLGLTVMTVRMRLRRGWSVERTLQEPQR